MLSANPIGGWMPNLDQLERLVAIEEIKQLKAQYFMALDAQDWDAYVSVFTEDAVMDLSEEMQLHEQGDDSGNDPVSHGREAIASFISGALDGGVTVHEGHMPVIQITGSDTATGIWQLHDWVQYETVQFHGFGHYHESYRKVDGRWLISFMTITRIRIDWSPTA
jgi:ketosteroid isomerase-like protein